MASKNDITLDVIWNRPSEEYKENLAQVDFTVKLGDEKLTAAANSDDAATVRYLEVSPEAFSFVSMPFSHPDHNLKLTFDGRTGQLIGAEIL